VHMPDDMVEPTRDRADADPDFRKALHHRWMELRNRRQEDDRYRDEWWGEQCGGCRFWLELGGPLGDDYGGCANPASPSDGRIRFEHDGCDAFVPGGPWYGE
jgi:hypothetical protein